MNCSASIFLEVPLIDILLKLTVFKTDEAKAYPLADLIL